MSRPIIVLFRNDLRIRDNEALYQATQDASTIIPLYCFDPRHFKQTAYGFPKTGAYRAQFLLESVQDLRFALQDLGGDLIIKHGKPEDVVFALAKYYNAQAVYCHQEATSEEIDVEDYLERHLETIEVPIDFFWGSTLYHYDDLPFPIDNLPDIFTDFRKQLERKTVVRDLFPTPEQIQLPEGIQTGDLPTLENLGITSPIKDKRVVMPFKGGETQALQRLKHYFWDSDQLQVYKETRNGLLGADYSSKFSPWLANGSISPRFIYEEIQRYEQEVMKNKSTYWLIFELIWRDFFRFVAMKFGNSLFYEGGLKGEAPEMVDQPELFEKWCSGMTGIPFVDANMRELKHTGFMSNRGRQNVASFLVKDLKIDWRMGAEWFESLLLDYDPCSNYGNWNYVAGIGNDPRENRYFNVVKQAKRYDEDGLYVKQWCRELHKLPSTRIHEPHLLNKVEQRYLKVRLGVDYPKPCVKLRSFIKKN